MQRLLTFPLQELRAIQRHRRDADAMPSDDGRRMALALALGRAGCTYEAALLLRPIRSHWKASKWSVLANETVEAQAWWSKNWREFVRLKRSQKKDTALALLGDRAVRYWDLPALLIHLGDNAAADDQLELASHLLQRVACLAERGLPKMNMEAFGYVAQAALVDVMHRRGDVAAALDRHRTIIANPGNAMAHEFQHVRLLVAAGQFDHAMRSAASILVTARKHRSGYSKVMRMEFIGTSPDLAPLRKRADWKTLLQDPGAYLRSTRT